MTPNFKTVLFTAHSIKRRTQLRSFEECNEFFKVIEKMVTETFEKAHIVPTQRQIAEQTVRIFREVMGFEPLPDDVDVMGVGAPDGLIDTTK